MDKIENIQAKEFDRKISSEIPVLVEFWIKSCGNCKKFKPVYETLSNILSKTKFTRINMFESIENLRLAEGLGVEQTPTTMIFKKSKKIGQIVGYKSLEDAKKEIKKIIK
jgi:thioredoxin-like negative regulator of GroEL